MDHRGGARNFVGGCYICVIVAACVQGVVPSLARVEVDGAESFCAVDTDNARVVPSLARAEVDGT
jgi:hypothetical protein